MVKKLRVMLTMLFIAMSSASLCAISFVKTSGFQTAKIRGSYQIFISHAIDLGVIMFNSDEDNYDSDEYGESEDDLVYGIGIGFPFLSKYEADIYIYGPFWSIWPVALRPSGFEAQVKFLCLHEGKGYLSLVPGYVASWGDYDDWDKSSFEVENSHSQGLRVPVIYTYQQTANTIHNVAVSFGTDWVTLHLRDYSHYPYLSSTKTQPITHWNIGYDNELRIGPVIIDLNLGLELYGGRGGKLRNTLTYGASMGTEW